MLEHGGRLLRASQHYAIAREHWLDLSSGIAPWAYPIPPIPHEAWARLPETEDGLEQAARLYYGAAQVLPVAGSQAAIQALPLMRTRSRVGVLSPCYAEHPHAWRRAGHDLIELADHEVDSALDQLDALVLVNPNNPTGRLITRARLLDWHARLAARGGWLVVDEAFIDNDPGESLAAFSERPGLIVLRSFGKFFGLAGVRLGFVLADISLLQRLAEHLGPWTLAGPTRVLGQACLTAAATHDLQRIRCAAASRRLAELLTRAALAPTGGCDLFQYLRTAQAPQLHDFLARRGILVRLFTEPAALRLGLPPTAADELRLDQALAAYHKDRQ
ncbi:threonine-phosphate decarboxylase CobD [Pseudomonas sp. RP23018S]|uniref:threonine-phosphate decarboxylase CobD n=1 Tax=Pseudomonas sp. RP23018S TaxID=3096037 RepID=UPI002ACA4227|nr:threonine-phosphate decarboxylase CobD [Pseudomonas sp. RP23018S]MDZ5602053.1 threonine-phosphate decarboxylase CobD [Pseudomonas sp. RP23018S]